jgi:hypothetical protein
VIAGDLQISFHLLSANFVFQLTLYLMMLYFAIFALVSVSYRRENAPPTHALAKARTTLVVASTVAVAAFLLMLFSGSHFPKDVSLLIELAAMLSSVPFAIAVAYRFYEFPFMDAFIREVLTGVMLLAAAAIGLSISTAPLWIAGVAISLAYVNGPLTRWVERTFLGYEESAEEQEDRIGTSIRALTKLDGFGACVSEILAAELGAEWVDIGSSARSDAVQHFEIPGSGMKVILGPRRGHRQYMSRQQRIARTAALQLSAHHHQLAQLELKEMTARAQIRALQAQINPHFLFNTLNVLASLIHSDPQKAERLTEELAAIFRYALESTQNEWVTLADELNFLEAYLGIEKARFEDRLRYTVAVDTSLRGMKIPPMILQPLVENAIKHGISQLLEGGEVRIRTQQSEQQGTIIAVENTDGGERPLTHHRGAGVGLRNVRERLDHIYGGAASFRLEEMPEGGTRAVLVLPEFARVRS